MKKIRLIYGNGTARYRYWLMVHNPKDYAECKAAAIKLLEGKGHNPAPGHMISFETGQHLPLHAEQAI